MQEHYSKTSYRELLELAKRQGFQFQGFHQPRSPERRIYLRHDVDYSLCMAAELAEMNASAGVHATFFLLLRSELYNLLAPSSVQFAHQIHEAGQYLGLHYPVSESITSADEFADCVHEEFEIVRRVLPMVQPVFSFHNPSKQVIDRFAALDLDVYVNAYHPQFTQEVEYCSDSNLRNSVADFAAILCRRDLVGLQLLMHPLNWISGGRHMLEVLARTWPQIIREREWGYGDNSVYRQALPDGVPAAVLEIFAQQWLTAAEARRHAA